MSNTPLRDASKLNALLDFFGSAVPPQPLWILGGLALIFGFWVTWFPLYMFLGFTDFFFISGARGGGYPYQTIHDVWRFALYLVILLTTAVVSIAVWKSVDKALAEHLTRVSARVGATLCALAVVVLFAGVGETVRVMTWIYGNDINDTYDSHRTATNAAKRVKRDPSFPLTGFWQTSCDDDGGISIERESRLLGLYRLEVCNNFSCRQEDDSKIIGDPTYRVIDSNTIEFQLPGNAYAIVDGARVHKLVYHRCG